MIWTAEGKILGVNHAALETFDCGMDDMIGSDISEIYAEQSDLTCFTGTEPGRGRAGI